MMTAAEARAELAHIRYAQNRISRELAALQEVAESVIDRVDRPMPGAIVRSPAGKLFRVVMQGTLKLDTLGDAGLIECDDWHLYDIVQDGAPDQPWPGEAK